MTEGGGVFYDLEGKMATIHSWGLSRMRNNMVEAHGLYHRLFIAKELQVSETRILGDSLLIVQHLNTRTNPQYHSVENILKSKENK